EAVALLDIRRILVAAERVMLDRAVVREARIHQPVARHPFTCRHFKSVVSPVERRVHERRKRGECGIWLVVSDRRRTILVLRSWTGGQIRGGSGDGRERCRRIVAAVRGYTNVRRPVEV